LIQKRFSDRVVIAMKFFQSRFDEKKSVKVCLKIFNQGLAAKSKTDLHQQEMNVHV